MFDSFLQAGFECSTHKISSGRRLDLVASTFHDRFVEQDYQRLRDIGIRTAREGLRWHLIEPARGCYDFSSAMRIAEAGERLGIQILWDILHFGWPDFLDVFTEEWVTAFGELTARFARLLRKETSSTAFFAPVNEISFLSWGGAEDAHIFPFERRRGAELKRQLARAVIQASRIILDEFPGARLISPEPVIHIIGDPNKPNDVRDAEGYRTSMFEAWDMLCGRLHPQLGGKAEYLDIIGINYYDANQWWNHGKTIFLGEPQYRPFREILREVHERYRRPMFVAETGTEDAKRPAWFRYICQEVDAARQMGIPVDGICLYPILNHPGWNDDRHCCNGLWDYPKEDGSRDIYEPLAAEIRTQQQLWKGTSGAAS